MSSIQFVQINARNLQETVEKIDGKKAIGFEVVDSTIIELLDCNIDPQHTGVWMNKEFTHLENKSASKWLLERIESFSCFLEDDQVLVLPSKLDLDCVVAANLYFNSKEISTWDKTTQQNWEKLNKLAEIVDTIDVVDCGLGNVSGNEWNPEHQKKQLLTDVTWYQILSAFLADFKVPLEEKINKIWVWLNDFSLTPFEQWERQVRREKLHQAQSTITLDPVPLVVSEARGATGLLYSISPYGVCYNPEFPTPNGTIRKFTVCQFNQKYLDLQGILAEINQLESGWGGNLEAGIIGSPFAGTNLTPQTVCEIVSRHVK